MSRTITAADLDSFMAFDTVIRVHDDGTVTDISDDVDAPDVTQPYALHGGLWYYDGEPTVQGWTLMSGYTGQHGAGNSAHMHSSEYIGGRMARDILSTPGEYVALMIPSPASMGYDPDDDETPGWCVAYRPMADN